MHIVRLLSIRKVSALAEVLSYFSRMVNCSQPIVQTFLPTRFIVQLAETNTCISYPMDFKKVKPILQIFTAAYTWGNYEY